MWKLREHIQLADDEDHWDEILKSTCGIMGDKNKESWGYLASRAKYEVTTVLFEQRTKRMDMARKMQEIVEKEQALADLEKLQRKTEKHRERKQRRLEQKTASTETLAREDTGT